MLIDPIIFIYTPGVFDSSLILRKIELCRSLTSSQNSLGFML